MMSFRKTLPAAVGLLFAGVMAASGVAPASAAAPFLGSQATALVGGTPLIQANCPAVPVPPGASASGTSTLGIVTVSGPAGAQCNLEFAKAAGNYAITGTSPTPLPFEASCTLSSGTTGGSVDVPIGTNVPGLGVVGVVTNVSTSVTVTYPDGTTAALNSVVSTANSVTRSAITITSGAAAGTVIGRVVCGSPIPYPLAVGTPSAGAASDVALTAVSSDDGGSSGNRALYVGGGIALLVLAQVAFGRTVWRRRHDAAGS